MIAPQCADVKRRHSKPMTSLCGYATATNGHLQLIETCAETMLLHLG
jgi:hypothetical protein